MAFTPEQEAELLALLAITDKTISQLEASPALTDSMLAPVENSTGTFAASMSKFKDYFLSQRATRTTVGVQYLKSNKNAIINGDFKIWQRGTSFTSVANLAYTADRFQYAKSGAMVHDLTLSNDAPTVAQAGRLITNSIKIDCQTIDASIGTGDFCLLTQKIEGYNFAPLAQKTMTLSFWVKATKTGKYCVAFRGGGWAYVAEYTINASNTWEFKTITIEASPSSGSWDYTNSTGITADFVLAGGATYQTTANSWQSGNFFATANQVNACDSASNDFLITGVQLEEGDVATPFENRTFADELQLCERYFEMLESGIIGATNANTSYAYWAFKTKKRATPSFSGGAGSQYASLHTVGLTHVTVQIANNFTFIAPNSSATSEL
jgi:hypothetical protein